MSHIGILIAGGVQFAHARREVFQLLLKLLYVREYAETFGKNGTAADLQPILRQITDTDALHGGDRAVVKRLHTGNDFQQGRFARAVPAHEAGAFFRRDQPVETVKQQLMSEPLSGSGELQHLSTIFPK